MIYKEFSEGKIKVSTLGMGCMRFPVKNGEIDLKRTKEIIDAAYRGGINYFDTAYVYHKGKSETVIGEMLKAYPRDSWYIADKFPGFNVPKGGWTREKIQSVFEEQLKKCGVEYFDFYLLHSFNESLYDIYTSEKAGILEFLKEQKAAGKIRFLGFSTHAQPKTTEKFMDWAGPCFDFVQIQLNYLDWTMQDARQHYEMITSRGIPVIVMEPCRGGKLAQLDKKNTEILKKVNPEASVASWAFDWIRALPNVSVILSGMSDMEQLEDNLKTFSKEPDMTEEKREAIASVVKSLTRGVPCTACRYCCECCPKGLNIPRLIGLYNESSYSFSPSHIFSLGSIEKEQEPSNCIQCGKCKKFCPQNIDIPAVMKKFDRKRGFLIKSVRTGVSLYKKIKKL